MGPNYIKELFSLRSSNYDLIRGYYSRSVIIFKKASGLGHYPIHKVEI